MRKGCRRVGLVGGRCRILAERQSGYGRGANCPLCSGSSSVGETAGSRGMKLPVGGSVRCPVVGPADPGQGPSLGERRRVGRFDRWASSPCFSFGRPCDLPGLSCRARIGLCRCPAGSPADCQPLLMEVRGGVAEMGRPRDRPGRAPRFLRGRDLRGRAGPLGRSGAEHA